MRQSACLFAVVAAVALAACDTDPRNYPARTFSWTGDIAAGSTVKIRNIDGAIAIVPSTNEKLTVTAEIVNAAPNAVQVRQTVEGNDMTFCTAFASSSKNDACGSDDHGHRINVSPLSFFSSKHHFTVRYALHVPSGVNVDVETVNGKIAAQNVAANVKAETVNGDVVVSTTMGLVNAETVNGSIIASMASLPDSGNVHLETVNGSVTSLIPDGIGGSIDLDNTNGSITANYPNAVRDSSDKHHLRLKINDDKRRVTLESVNGSVNVTRYVKAPVVSLEN